jgi:hypothetical protein
MFINKLYIFDAIVLSFSYCFLFIVDNVYLNIAANFCDLKTVDKNINTFLTIARLSLLLVSPKKLVIIFLATPGYMP